MNKKKYNLINIIKNKKYIDILTNKFFHYILNANTIIFFYLG